MNGDMVFHNDLFCLVIQIIYYAEYSINEL